MKAYEEAMTETSTAAPWYIIPADKKWYARLVISKILIETFKSLNLKFPELPKNELLKLDDIKQQLLDEK